MIRGFARAMRASRRWKPLAVACWPLLACAWGAADASALDRAEGSSGAALAILSDSPGAAATQGSGRPAGSAWATLAQCFTAGVQAERSATFSGEMTAIPVSVRMAMQIVLQMRLPGEAAFHAVSAPGLGAWRVSDPGVRDFKYLRQVTNLPAPASYRAVVRFRWLNARNHPVKVAQRRTARCEQPTHTPIAPGGSPM